MIIILTKLKNKCPIILLVILSITLFFIIYSSIIPVKGSAGFYESDVLWKRIKLSLDVSKDETYPYDQPKSSNVTINSVALDIIYGNSRSLANYFGEVPFYNSRNEAGTPEDEYNGIYAEDGTTLTPGVYDGWDEDYIENYWGFTTNDSTVMNGLKADDDGIIPKADLEKINDNGKIYSLRLYALSMAKDSWIDNIPYTISSFLAWVASWIVKLVIIVKNIDTEAILKFLKLDELYNTLSNAFIYNSDTGQLSAITAFAIIFFMIAIIGYVIRYIGGKDKTTGLKDIIVLSLAGLLIIGMCLSGSVWSLGTSVSNLSAKLMGSVAGSFSGIGQAFTTDIDDSKNESKIINLQEITMVNKAYMDVQICSQFGVNNVSSLNFSKLGDDDGAIAKDTLIVDHKDAGKVDLETNFNNNLGYYFWFADSGAKSKTDLNKTFPTNNAGASERKLNSMITYLQKVHNKNEYTTENGKTSIPKIVQHFANPNGMMGCLKLFLLTAVFVLLALCCGRYAIMVIINKFGMFLSLIGMTVAGPLILTTNKELVKYGKMIISNIIMCLVKITIYSMVFDTVLYLTGALLQTTTLLAFILTGALLWLFLQIKPMIDQAIKKFIDNIDRKLDGGSHEFKRAIIQRGKELAGKGIDKFDNKAVVIGHDDDGNAIYGNRKGSAMSRLMHGLHNAAFNEGTNQMRENERIKENSAAGRKANQDKLRTVPYKNAQNKYRTTKNVINEQANQLAKRYEAETKALEESIRYKDINGKDTYNADNLNANESKYLNDMQAAKDKQSALMNSSIYQQILDKEVNGEELSKEEQTTKANYEASINHLGIEANNSKRQLDNSINDRIKSTMYSEFDLDKDVDDVNDAIKIKVQNDNKDALMDAMDSLENTSQVEADTLKKGDKLGSADEVNSEAIRDFIQVKQDRQDLADGVAIKDSLTQENKDIANTIIHKNGPGNIVLDNTDFKAANTDLRKAQSELNSATTRQERSEAKAKVAKAKQKRDEAAKKARSTDSEIRKNISGMAISDQINSVIANSPTKGGSKSSAGSKNSGLNFNLNNKNKTNNNTQ